MRAISFIGDILDKIGEVTFESVAYFYNVGNIHTFNIVMIIGKQSIVSDARFFATSLAE